MNFSYALRGLPPAAPTYARQEARSEGPWAGAQPWGTSVPAGQRSAAPGVGQHRATAVGCVEGVRHRGVPPSSGPPVRVKICSVRILTGGTDRCRADTAWGKVMSERPVTVIGFVPAALATPAEFRPDRSVILIEEPGVVRTRGVRAAAADAPVVRELVEWDTRRRARLGEASPATPAPSCAPWPRTAPSPRPRVPRTGELRRRRRLRPAGQQDPRPAQVFGIGLIANGLAPAVFGALRGRGTPRRPAQAGPLDKKSGAGSSTSRAGSASISSTDRTSSPPIFTTPGRESPSEASASCSSAP